MSFKFHTIKKLRLFLQKRSHHSTMQEKLQLNELLKCHCAFAFKLHS